MKRKFRRTKEPLIPADSLILMGMIFTVMAGSDFIFLNLCLILCLLFKPLLGYISGFLVILLALVLGLLHSFSIITFTSSTIININFAVIIGSIICIIGGIVAIKCEKV